MSNGRVERVFSALKLIKTERRSSLSEDYLDNILRIVVDGPPISEWDSSCAIQLWWQDKQRRNVGDTRKAPKKSKDRAEVDDGTQQSAESSKLFLNLDEWENLVGCDETDDSDVELLT